MRIVDLGTSDQLKVIGDLTIQGIFGGCRLVA